ncbi:MULTISPECIES: LytTR family DNA-binding domain-containing protein [unclassified Lentimicrobium]|uniref:LytR/AlgR family response regulator transcription factor n=1 Tax=unclassified Lentimicrobium TaxID=2677434 RepID=UPI00155507F5|nr:MULTISPECIES: response regulator transcription factor [unclassified Lentimicrobium]NPD46460.1 response regulator transcription factor [Lentimicrobium sp. S6]NPD86607.1 response regulator transcription factor [Lentimicrobium sp. L6]
MEMKKIAIIEDDEIIAQMIVRMLEKHGYVALPPASTFEEGIALIEDNVADVFLLDIHLQGEKDGIELGKIIQNSIQKPFLFLTSETCTSLIDRAVKTKPSAYLAKPFKMHDLYSALEICFSQYQEPNQEPNWENQSQIIKQKSLFIKQEQAFVKIDQNSIFYIKSEHVYLSIFLSNGKKHLVRGCLKDIIKQLGSSFIRTQRSYIINKDYIESYNKRHVVIDNQSLPIGEKYLESFNKHINN